VQLLTRVAQASGAGRANHPATSARPGKSVRPVLRRA
jgi:hypothetical protein